MPWIAFRYWLTRGQKHCMNIGSSVSSDIVLWSPTYIRIFVKHINLKLMDSFFCSKNGVKNYTVWHRHIKPITIIFYAISVVFMDFMIAWKLVIAHETIYLGSYSWPNSGKITFRLQNLTFRLKFGQPNPNKNCYKSQWMLFKVCFFRINHQIWLEMISWVIFMAKFWGKIRSDCRIWHSGCTESK